MSKYSAVLKLFRGGEADDVLTTKRQTIDATDSLGHADVYSRLGKGDPQVGSMQVEPKQPVELGSTVTVDALSEH